jgi:hypothetical protein
LPTVHVFNTTEESVSLALGGGPAGQLPGTFAGNGPASTEIEPEPQSLLSVMFSGSTGPQAYLLDLQQIRSADCQLYIFQEIAVLAWPGGQSVLSPASASPDEEE